MRNSSRVSAPVGDGHAQFIGRAQRISHVPVHSAQREVRVGVVAFGDVLQLHLDDRTAGRAGAKRLHHRVRVEAGLVGHRYPFAQRCDVDGRHPCY